MLRHLTNIPVSDLTHQSALIKERNAYIRANKFSVIEGEIANFGDVYIIGEAHVDAAKWLDKKLYNATEAEHAVACEREAEDVFDVQVWSSTDLDIAKIKG